MEEKQITELKKIIDPTKILLDCEMKDYTTFRVGGKAEAICFPENSDQLIKIVSYLRKEVIPYIVIGNGSNLLVKDRGINGVVIILRGELSNIEMTTKTGHTLLAGAGVPLSKLLTYCASKGLGGAEFLAGIPGTLGGAVAMNAGAYEKEIKDIVLEIRIVTNEGEAETIDVSKLDFNYRKLSLPKGAIIQDILLGFKDTLPEVIKTNIAKFLRHRKKTQPLEYSSGGSVFKNPPNEYAGRLIEAAGLKGKKIGGAMISIKHANFIVNTGDAKANDIIMLMDMAKKYVIEKTGIELEPEIRIVGRG